MNRRSFLRGAATLPIVAAAPVAAAAPAAAQEARAAVARQALSSSLDIKHLQAEFYRLGIAAGLLAGREADYVNEISNSKQQHVAALARAMVQEGGQPPAPQAFDFGDAFADRQRFLETAYEIESVAVRGSISLPAAQVNTTSFRDLTGLSSVDSRAKSVVAVLTGMPVEGGIFFEGGLAQALTPEETTAALSQFITGPPRDAAPTD